MLRQTLKRVFSSFHYCNSQKAVSMISKKNIRVCMFDHKIKVILAQD